MANCAFGGDGRTLYMTSHDFLARVQVRASGMRKQQRSEVRPGAKALRGAFRQVRNVR